MRWLVGPLSVICLAASVQAQAPKAVQEPIGQSELVQIKSMITSCLRKHWRLPKTGRPVVVTLRWDLGEDGRLLGQPRIVNPEPTPDIMPSANQANRAVRACQPFRLPAARYSVWKTIIWDFDPRAN